MGCRMSNAESVFDHPRSASYARYIETIRGLVDASEFEMHVTYLHGINSEAFKKFKKQLLATAFINHEQTRKRFMEYVEALRSAEIDYDEFEVHVSRLREYTGIKIDKEEQYRYSILFDETKMFFWKVTPSDYETRAISENESVKNLYKIVSGIDYETATLGLVLRSLGLLELVGDYNIELVCVIKKMLHHYHPDRNRHEKAKEIFTLIEDNVHKPISIILEDFEKYTDCSYTSCQLDEFLTWRIAKIKEVRDEEEKNLHHSLENRGKKALAIYNHLLSKVEPEGDFGYSVLDERFKWQRPPNSYNMKNYKSEKADILKVKDKILNVFRTLIRELISLAQNQLLLEKKVKLLEEMEANERRNHGIIIEDIKDVGNEAENNDGMLGKKFKQLEDTEGNGRRNLEMVIGNLENEIKENVKFINESEKCLENEKNNMKSLVKFFVPLFDPMIERYQKEIYYLKNVCAGKVDFEEKWKIRYDWNEDHINKCRRMIKEEKLNTFVDERRLRLYEERFQKLNEEKEIMESLLDYLSQQSSEPWTLIKDIKEYCTKEKDYALLKVCPILKFFISNIPVLDYKPYNLKGLALEFMSACQMYEQLKCECMSPEEKDIENLCEKYEDFNNSFKTEEEKYKESQKNKKRFGKKELLVLMKERKAAEEEIIEARKGSEKARAKAENLKSLLLKYKRGDLSLSELQNIDIKSLDVCASCRE